MKRFTIISSIFILSTLVIVSCGKHDSVKTIPTVNPTPPVDSTMIRVSKMGGVWNWHGIVDYHETMPSFIDTTYEILDTLGWIIVDSSAIVKQFVSNGILYSFGDTLKLTSSDDTVLIFDIASANLDERVIYNYRKNTMFFRSFDYTHGSTTIVSLYTP
jgi:hypothetical protein